MASSRDPEIHDLFPLGEEAVSHAFGLVRTALESGTMEQLASEVAAFAAENEALYRFCSTMAEIGSHYAGGNTEIPQMFILGALTCYIALKKEAEQRGAGYLPQLPQKFIEATQKDFLSETDTDRVMLSRLNPQDAEELERRRKIEEGKKKKAFESFLRSEHQLNLAFMEVLPGIVDAFGALPFSSPRYAWAFKFGAFDIHHIFRTYHEWEELRSRIYLGSLSDL